MQKVQIGTLAANQERWIKFSSQDSNSNGRDRQGSAIENIPQQQIFAQLTLST
jgi:hypothetical protein